MPNHHTRRSTSAQDNSTSYTEYSGSARREGTRRKFQFLARVKASLTSNSGRKICEAHKVSHRLAADLANEIASGPYPSLVSSGYVYVGQKALGEVLSVHERQVRRAVAVLAALGLLRIERDHRGRRTNRMIPLLHGGPLFGGTDRAAHHRAKTSSTQGAGVSSAERASAPSNLKVDEEINKSSPKEHSPIGALASALASMEEEIKTNVGAVNGAERSNRGVTLVDPLSVNEQERLPGTGAFGSSIEITFAVLMRTYPHPVGQLQNPAYEPHALKAWREIGPAQQADAVRAAAKAPGKVWLGHWLYRGGETGHFENLKQQAVAPRVWVREDTPQWKAWEEYLRARGRRPQKTQRKVGGELQTGWMFESERPPGVDASDRGVRDE